MSNPTFDVGDTVVISKAGFHLIGNCPDVEPNTYGVVVGMCDQRDCYEVLWDEKRVITFWNQYLKLDDGSIRDKKRSPFTRWLSKVEEGKTQYAL